MSFFGNIGRTTSSVADVIVTTAESLSTVGKSAKLSADVLVIKAQSLKEETAIEAKVTRYEAMKKLHAFKASVEKEAGEGFDVAQMDKDFNELMEEYK